MNLEISRDTGRLKFVKRFVSLRMARVGLATIRNLDGPQALKTLFCDPISYIGQEITFEGAYEARELRLLGALFARFADFLGRPLEVAWDVGANIGNHSVVLAKHFQEVHCFEPHPFTHQVLQVNLQWLDCRNALAVPFGLSDHSQRVAFSDSTDLGGNRVLSSNAPESRTILVDLRKGDELSSQLLAEGAHLDFVKIDVESHERAVLVGMEKLLSVHQPIVAFECDGRSQNVEMVADVLSGYRFYEFASSSGFLEWLLPGRSAQLGLSLLLGRQVYCLRPVVKFRPAYYPMILAVPSCKNHLVH